MKEVADNVTGHRGVIINAGAARATRHRRRRRDRDRDAQAQRARPRGGAPGHTPRHAAADRPVRPLGHAGGQRLRRAEHELAGDDVAGADRCHRLGRRHRAREDRSGRRRCGHDPLGDGRGPAALRRLPDLHRIVQARQRHPARGAVAARARHGVRRVPRRAARLRAGGLPALRRAAVHGRCARPRRPSSAPTASSPSTTTCASAAPTAPWPAPTRRATRPTAPSFAFGEATRERDAAPRRATAWPWPPSAPSASSASTPAWRKGLKPGVDPEATPACVNACISEAMSFRRPRRPAEQCLEAAGREPAFPHARRAGHRARLLLPVGQGGSTMSARGRSKALIPERTARRDVL